MEEQQWTKLLLMVDVPLTLFLCLQALPHHRCISSTPMHLRCVGDGLHSSVKVSVQRYPLRNSCANSLNRRRQNVPQMALLYPLAVPQPQIQV